GHIGINLPAGTCNGDYYALSITDPLDHMLEISETNNWILIPVTLTMQTGGNFEPQGFLFQVHATDVNFSSNALNADSIVWYWGDGSQADHVTGSINSSHSFPSTGQFIVQ